MRSYLIHRSRLAKLLALLPWLVAAPVRAVPSAWIDFAGTIKGEATETNHIDWIEIEAFQIAAKLTAGQPGAFYFTKFLDRASPALFLACPKQTKYPRANLDFNMDSGAGGPLSLLRLELEDVRISSAQISGNSSNIRPVESIGLAFGRITYTYYLGGTTSLSSNYDYRFQTGSSGTGSNPDTDADGMADAWETIHSFSIGSNEGSLDADGDGLSNLNEYRLGTHPRSGTSFFKAQLTPVSASPGTYQLSWNSVIGTTYIVEWSPDLITPFTPQRTITATATTSSANMVNAGAVGFYRVRPQL